MVSKKIATVSLLFFFLLTIGFLYWCMNSKEAGNENESYNESEEIIYCPADVKVCLDGSYVSRIAPNCEFSLCPEDNKQTDSNLENNSYVWKTYINNETGLSFEYPEDIMTNYISIAENWPPSVEVIDEEYYCSQEGGAMYSTGEAFEYKIGDNNYCLSIASEGAAGSVYTTYKYSSAFGDQTASVVFTLRFVECHNYDDPDQSQCEEERSFFNPDHIVDHIVQSIKFSS